MRDPLLMHKLAEIDVEQRTAICAVCGPVKIRSAGQRTKWRCAVRASQLRKRQPYYGYKHRTIALKGRSIEDVHCAHCKFEPEDLCQIDVHHQDRDHKNNDLANLVLLCANCHRLEHKRSLLPPLHTGFP